MKEKIDIKDKFGHRVSGILSVPKNSSIIVVMSHGFTSNRNTKLYKELQKEFNSRGIGTVRYEYYGHGAAYEHRIRGVSRDITVTKAAESLRTLMKYLRRKGYGRIGLIGSSFGGLLSLVIASDDKMIKFLALKSPVTDPVKFWNESVRGPKNKLIVDEWKKNDIFHYNREGEDYMLKWDFWNDLKNYDADRLAKGVSCPIFLIHGNKDKIVPIKYSKKFAKTTGAKLAIVRGADHHYSKQENYKTMKAAIKNFVLNQAIK